MDLFPSSDILEVGILLWGVYYKEIISITGQWLQIFSGAHIPEEQV